MFDIALRPLKDDIFNPLSRSIPHAISPLHITLTAFALGLLSVLSSYAGNPPLALLLWALNRSLDCLDGAVARHRNQQSDVGGFIDLLCDFTVYSLVPIGAALGRSRGGYRRGTEAGLAGDLLAVAFLEAACWLNNFVLFYIAAVAEKTKAEAGAEGDENGNQGAGRKRTRELTSVMMRPALVEGAESAVFFTLMLGFPGMVGELSYLMFVGVMVGTGQRVVWLVDVLGKGEQKVAA